MARGVVGGSPTNLSQFLKGVRFPCTRDDLIRYVRNQGADQDVIETLNGMPDRRYDDMADVMRGYGQFEQDVGEDFEVNVDEEDTEEVPQQRRRA